MKASEFDKKFDDNLEDMIEYLDLSTARRPNQEKHKQETYKQDKLKKGKYKEETEQKE